MRHTNSCSALFCGVVAIMFSSASLAEVRLPWQGVAGKGQAVSTQNVASTWLLGNRGEIYKRGDNGWIRKPGQATQLVARYNGAFHLGADGKSMYVSAPNGWNQLPGQASFIAAGIAGTVSGDSNHDDLWHLSYNQVGADGHRIFYWDSRRGGWQALSASYLAKRIAVGAGGHVYRVTKSGEIYHSSDKGVSWVRRPGKASEIATFGLRPSIVWHLSQDTVDAGGKAIYESSDYGKNWRKVSGTATSISLGKIAGSGAFHAYHTNANRNIYFASVGALSSPLKHYAQTDRVHEENFESLEVKTGANSRAESKELTQLQSGSCAPNDVACLTSAANSTGNDTSQVTNVNLVPTPSSACPAGYLDNKTNVRSAAIYDFKEYFFQLNGWTQSGQREVENLVGSYSKPIKCGKVLFSQAEFYGKPLICPDGLTLNLQQNDPTHFRYCYKCPDGYRKITPIAPSSEAACARLDVRY